jgi:uncharacterized membrane protein YtjA (UPF0391 family)
MLRWSAFSVVTAVAAVLFGFDGISSGARAVSSIAAVGAVALLLAVVADRALRRPSGGS